MAIIQAKNLDRGVRAFFDIIGMPVAQPVPERVKQSPNDALIEELMNVRFALAEVNKQIDALVVERDKLAQSLQAGVDKLLKTEGTSNPVIARVMTR